MVSAVFSLPQVLYEAQRHAVEEIAIERGEPVTFHGDQGALILGGVLGDADISDALSQVLAPDQQAELAVAGVVEFAVEGYTEWSLVAETAAEGVVIRGRRRHDAASRGVGAPLDIPPLRPFQPEPGADMPPSDSVLQAGGRSTRWDVGLAGSMFDESGSDPGPSEFDGSDPSARSLPSADPGPLADDAAIDFALVGSAGPGSTDELREFQSGPTGTLPLQEADRSGRGPTQDIAPSRPQARMGVRPTMHGADTLAAHVDALDPGTVVYLAGMGVGERLLQQLDEGYETIDDETWTTVTTIPIEELAVGSGYLVRMEDPSRCVPWLLRRLEEGARVVVEGRARTAAGARRILLGPEATPHLVQWIDAHQQLWLYNDGVAWQLEPF